MEIILLTLNPPSEFCLQSTKQSTKRTPYLSTDEARKFLEYLVNVPSWIIVRASMAANFKSLNEIVQPKNKTDDKLLLYLRKF